jgi:hypothetical protein
MLHLVLQLLVSSLVPVLFCTKYTRDWLDILWRTLGRYDAICSNELALLPERMSGCESLVQFQARGNKLRGVRETGAPQNPPLLPCVCRRALQDPPALVPKLPRV